MIYGYVVERIERGSVTHIGAESIQEAEQILCSIPRSYRGSVYPLYDKNILLPPSNEENE